MSPIHIHIPLTLPLPRLSLIARPGRRTPLTTRPFTHTTPLKHPRKDAQHKDSINTEATEYSKSGSDDAAARQETAAFDPGTTRPEAERAQAGRGRGAAANPLEVSPANGEVSRGTSGEGGAEGGGGEGKASGFGRGEKRG